MILTFLNPFAWKWNTKNVGARARKNHFCVFFLKWPKKIAFGLFEEFFQNEKYAISFSEMLTTYAYTKKCLEIVMLFFSAKRIKNGWNKSIIEYNFYI